MEDNFPNFFKWTFTKWYFWVIFFVWGLWAGSEELRAYYITEFLVTLFISFVLVLIIFLIPYSIKRFICKKVQEEVKSNSRKVRRRR